MGRVTNSLSPLRGSRIHRTNTQGSQSLALGLTLPLLRSRSPLLRRWLRCSAADYAATGKWKTASSQLAVWL